MSPDPCTAAASSSSAVGAVACSSKEEDQPRPPLERREEQEPERAEGNSAAVVMEEHADSTGQKLAEASPHRSEEEVAEEEDDEEEGGEDEEGRASEALDLGPRISIKEQLDKDKDDESLRRWKEQLLGTVDFNLVGETLEPEVKIMSLCIMSPGRPDASLPLPVEPGSNGSVWFTLKEGSSYRLKFTFSVSGNIVSGLRYTNTVWKTGIKVDSTKEMLGTFSPRPEPYTYLTPEDTTPSGLLARGSYSARTKFVDDDQKCYLEINYGFDIRREWPPS